MRTTHKYTDTTAKNITLFHGLRTKFKRTEKPLHTDYHKPQLCPLGCTAVVKRITKHLKNVHKLSSIEQLRILGSGHIISDAQKSVSSVANNAMNSSTACMSGSVLSDSPGVSCKVNMQAQNCCRAKQDCIPTIPLVLPEFYDWLISVQGGRKDLKTAKTIQSIIENNTDHI
jgi:hypothetical protein